MDDRSQRPDANDAAGSREHDVADKGQERSEGRPRGVPGDARPASEGRPSAVRDAQPQPTPPADQMPTEDPVDRGQAPDTEHQPGGDL